MTPSPFQSNVVYLCSCPVFFFLYSFTCCCPSFFLDSVFFFMSQSLHILTFSFVFYTCLSYTHSSFSIPLFFHILLQICLLLFLSRLCPAKTAFPVRISHPCLPINATMRINRSYAIRLSFPPNFLVYVAPQLYFPIILGFN